MDTLDKFGYIEYWVVYWVYTQKSWVFGYGYNTHTHTQYPTFFGCTCMATPKPIALELQKELPKWEGLKLKHLILGVYTINRNLVKSNSLEAEKIFLKFNDSSFIILKDKFHEYDVISQKYAIENPFIWYGLTFKMKSFN